MEGAAMSPSEEVRGTGRSASSETKQATEETAWERRCRDERIRSSEKDGQSISSGTENGTEEGWEQQRADAEYTRLERVQSSANVWLGILGTLFTLSGAVVLVQGSTAFIQSSNNTLLHWLLIGLVVATFVAAILALMMGSAATWGGLENPAALHPPLKHVLLDKLIEYFGKSEDIKRSIRDRISPSSYAAMYNKSADRRRVYLHYSRGIGIAAALLAGGMVIWIFIAGTISKASPDVIVVHQGRVTCAPVRNAEKYVGVTQVISVAQC
jgi:hypothetical protein